MSTISNGWFVRVYSQNDPRGFVEHTEFIRTSFVCNPDTTLHFPDQRAIKGFLSGYKRQDGLDMLVFEEAVQGAVADVFANKTIAAKAIHSLVQNSLKGKVTCMETPFVAVSCVRVLVRLVELGRDPP